MDPHKLDDFFRGKLANPNPPPFNEAHWKEARNMLHPGRGRRWQWGLLFLGIFLTGLFIFSKSVLDDGVQQSENYAHDAVSKDREFVADGYVEQQEKSPEKNSSEVANEIQSGQESDPLSKMNRSTFSRVGKDRVEYKDVDPTSEIHSGKSTNRNSETLVQTNNDKLLERASHALVAADETQVEISPTSRSRMPRLTLLDGREGLINRFPSNQLSTSLTGASIVVERFRRNRVGFFGTLVLRPSTGESPVRGIIFGADVNRFISSNWFVGIRPSMHLRFNEPGFTKFQHHVSYSFESINTTYGLHAHSLQLVRLPIFLGYEADRHQLRLGLALEYLLGARGNLQEIAVEDDAIRVIKNLSSGWIETGAMKKFNAQFYGGYNYAFNDMMHFGIDIQYRATEIFPQLSNQQSLVAGQRWYMGLTALFNLK